MYFRFNHSILGGTFDHLHKGHKSFLDQVFEFSEKVTIGLTTNEFASRKALSSAIIGYNVRKKSLEEYLKSKNYIDRAKIIPIRDIFGISLQESNIDGIFVTDSGYENALLINEKRQKKNFPPLIVAKVDLVEDAAGNIISSTNIRLGEIDREGNVYNNLFKKKKKYVVPQGMRANLKEPFGEIVDEVNLENYRDDFLIAVGDITVSSFIKRGITPNICIFDRINERKKISNPEIIDYLPEADYRLKNKAGSINCTTAITIGEIIHTNALSNRNVSIFIDGEEDLLAIPCILFAPLNSFVFYGLKSVGIIGVAITEEVKQKIISEYLNKFV